MKNRLNCIRNIYEHLFLPQRLLGNEFGNLGDQLRSRGVENATGKLETVLKASKAQEYIQWLTRELTKGVDSHVRSKIELAATQIQDNVENDMPVKNTERIMWFLQQALQCVPNHLKPFAQEKIASWEKFKTEIPTTPSFKSAHDVTRDPDAALVRLSAMVPTAVSIKRSLQTPGSASGLVDAVYNYCRDKYTNLSLKLLSVDFSGVKTEIQTASTPLERAQKIESILTSLLEEYRLKANVGNSIPSLEAGLQNQLALYQKVIGDLQHSPAAPPTAPPAAAPAAVAARPAPASAPQPGAGTTAPRGNRRPAAADVSTRDAPSDRTARAAARAPAVEPREPAAPAAAAERAKSRVEKAADVTKKYVTDHSDKITAYGFKQVFEVDLTDTAQKIYDAVLAKQTKIRGTSTDKKLRDGRLGDVTYDKLSADDRNKLKALASTAAPAAAVPAPAAAPAKAPDIQSKAPELPEKVELPFLKPDGFYRVKKDGDGVKAGDIIHSSIKPSVGGILTDAITSQGKTLPAISIDQYLERTNRPEDIYAYKAARYTVMKNQLSGVLDEEGVQVFAKNKIKVIKSGEHKGQVVFITQETPLGAISIRYENGDRGTVSDDKVLGESSREQQDRFIVEFINGAQLRGAERAQRRALSDTFGHPTSPHLQEYTRATAFSVLPSKTKLLYMSPRTRNFSDTGIDLGENVRVAILNKTPDEKHYEVVSQFGDKGYIEASALQEQTIVATAAEAENIAYEKNVRGAMARFLKTPDTAGSKDKNPADKITFLKKWLTDFGRGKSILHDGATYSVADNDLNFRITTTKTPATSIEGIVTVDNYPKLAAYHTESDITRKSTALAALTIPAAAPPS